MSHTPRPQSRQRDPPPSLFLRPSPNASNVSLSNAPPPSVSFRGQSSLRPDFERSASIKSGRSGTVVTPNPSRPGYLTAESARTYDRTDTLWSQMQATLEEIELSASGGTHVFGPDHDRKLAELRAAQIALAQAWARSEADDAIDAEIHEHTASVVGDGVRNMRSTIGDASRSGAPDGTEGGRSTIGSSSVPRPNSSGTGVEGLGAKLEEETEVDILLARKRREANDRYFQRVNQGVIDVVSKLEDVAVAMRAVEQESKEVWSENDSVPGAFRM